MPPFGHAWTQGETLRRPRDGPVAAPPQLGTGRSVATAPPTGHEVAKGNLYRPWTVTGPRGQGGMQEATAEVEAVACSQAGRGVGRRGWRRTVQTNRIAIQTNEVSCFYLNNNNQLVISLMVPLSM